MTKIEELQEDLRELLKMKSRNLVKERKILQRPVPGLEKLAQTISYSINCNILNEIRINILRLEFELYKLEQHN